MKKDESGGTIHGIPEGISGVPMVAIQKAGNGYIMTLYPASGAAVEVRVIEDVEAAYPYASSTEKTPEARIGKSAVEMLKTPGEGEGT